MPIIATWNVNSIRPRLEHLLQWLKERSPDVALLQETKVEDHAFPREALEDLGYNLAFHGQKTYNGVAILSKGPLEDVTRGLPMSEEDTQARYIEALTTLDGKVYRVASIYVPNGQDITSEKFTYKLGFLQRLHRHLTERVAEEEAFILGGDFNIAPEAIDVHNPAAWEGQILFTPDERAALRGLLHLGYSDAFRSCHPQSATYSWWDYRNAAWPANKGLRIDHLLLSPEATDILREAGIDRDTRGWDKPSDHAPVWCRLA